MAQPTLKSLLGKRTETTAWLKSWVASTKTEISIEDHQQNLLFGNELNDTVPSFCITLDDEIVGSVTGTDAATADPY